MNLPTEVRGMASMKTKAHNPFAKDELISDIQELDRKLLAKDLGPEERTRLSDERKRRFGGQWVRHE